MEGGDEKEKAPTDGIEPTALTIVIDVISDDTTCSALDPLENTGREKVKEETMAVDLESGGECSEMECEKICRICHLSSELVGSVEEGWELIEIGCGCKEELGIAHRRCAEAWFRVKGNRVVQPHIHCTTMYSSIMDKIRIISMKQMIQEGSSQLKECLMLPTDESLEEKATFNEIFRLCEICGLNAKSIVGKDDFSFMELWHEGRRRPGGSNNLNLSNHGTYWTTQRFCTFLVSFLLIAFILQWYFRESFD